MLRDAESQYALQIVRSGHLLASRIELAVDSQSRRRGLLGRDKLDEGAGLIIAPCSAIHTFSMRFAIDVVFLARDGKVLKTYTALERGRIAFSLSAFAVVELPSGVLTESGVMPGDDLRLIVPKLML